MSYKLAEGQYRDALAHAKEVKNSTAELDKLRVTILQNMSVCTNNTEDFKETIKNCTTALSIDANAKKAIYLRSVAHLKSHNIDDAMADIKAAIKMDPSDGNLRQHFEVVKKEKADK